MNRWRQRLAALHSEDGARLHAATPSCVQIVQNVQNPIRGTTFEHFERIEQPTALPAASVIKGVTVRHDSGTPSEWAEGFARLNRELPPADVPLLRWQRFIGDGRRFFDGRFYVVAADLGWSALDLFGCDQNKPYARIDQVGLIWLLNGDQLVLLAEGAAVIETRTGARQTYHRRPSAPGRALAWDMVS